MIKDTCPDSNAQQTEGFHPPEGGDKSQTVTSVHTVSGFARPRATAQVTTFRGSPSVQLTEVAGLGPGGSPLPIPAALRSRL